MPLKLFCDLIVGSNGNYKIYLEQLNRRSRHSMALFIKTLILRELCKAFKTSRLLKLNFKLIINEIFNFSPFTRKLPPNR